MKSEEGKWSTQTKPYILTFSPCRTSTVDGTAIARAVLSYFVTDKRSRTLFITHYPMLTALASVFPDLVTNYHMGYQESFNGEYTEVIFLYKLVKGISKGSYG
jgi:DNA mismatch repair protein MSH3